MSFYFAVLHLSVTSLVLSFYDLRNHKIYQKHLIVALLLTIPFISIKSIAFGVLNFLFLLALHHLSRRGIGMGDVRLSFLIGIYVGSFAGDWRTIVYANLISWILAGSIATTLIILKRTSLRGRLAFAPFMFVGLYSGLILQR